jgi:hypothetical protein
MVMMIMMITMMMTTIMKENYVVKTQNMLYVVIFSAPVQTSLLYNAHRVLPGGKAAGALR